MIIDDILYDWVHSIPNGLIDTKNITHQANLIEILRNMNYEEDRIQEVMASIRGEITEERMVPNPNPSPNARKDMVTLSYARTFYEKEGHSGLSDDEIEQKAKEDNKEKSKEKQPSDTGDRTANGYLDDNNESIDNFIKTGFVNSRGAPGSAGSMLNELVSIKSATGTLNSGKQFDYDIELSANINILKNGYLGKENNSDNPSGRVKKSEAKDIADKYGISIGLASKCIIATKAAQRKNDRILNNIIKKNDLKNFKAIPLFGDKKGLQSQLNIVQSAKGKIKLGNTIIDHNTAIEIINNSGGGKNPSDTAIFVADNNTGDIYMSFYTDKDSTKAIQSNSNIRAENAEKKKIIDDLIEKNTLTKEQSIHINNIIDVYLKQYQELETQLTDVTSGPKSHLKKQKIDNKLIDIAKNTSKGSDPQKYWNELMDDRFSNPNKKIGKKIARDFLPKNHKNPPSDSDILSAYIKYINDPDITMTKHDQRIIVDLSNATNGPKFGEQIGDIRKKTTQTDISLIHELDKQKIKINGIDIGIGTYLEAKSVSEKLHFGMLFGGEDIYRDPDGFIGSNGDVVVDKNVLNKCLPTKTEDDLLSHFEIGEERETIQTGTSIVTGGSKIVYAVNKNGERNPIGVKVQRSKSGLLGKLETVYKFHPNLQRCIDINGKK